MSILIKNGKVFLNGGLVEKNILIIDNTIKQITSERVTVDKVINAMDKIILPGMIDAHVHFREPGYIHKEDFLSGSRAAAKGGVTTVLDMPNTNPPTASQQLLDEKRELAKKSIVNYGFHFGATKDNSDELRKMQNIASVKVFMDSSTGSMQIDDESILKKTFQNAKIISAHAEEKNVERAVDMILGSKNKLYLCHISLESELKMVKKSMKHKIFCEATPHHLFLSQEDESKIVKMKPSLKSKQDQEALWKAIAENKIDTIASDHAPHLLSEKESGDVYGVPGVETTLPLMLDAVNKNRISLQKVIELCCHNPAKIFKIANKGYIAEEYDADIVIVDMNLEKEVKNEELFTKCGWSPFSGKVLKGCPVIAIVNGKIVYENGNVYDIKAREVEFQ